MKTRSSILVLTSVLLLAGSGLAQDELKGLPPLDYAEYYSVLPKMEELSKKANKSVRTLHTLMSELLQTDPKDEAKAAGIRAQIRPVLVEHKALKEQMIGIVDKVIRKAKPERTDEDALRALRTTTLRRVGWNNTFLKYVSRDISHAIGVPIRLNAKVQELNQVEIFFPEISADGVMSLLCESFDLKWIIYGGEFYVLKKIGKNEARFLEWEKKHGKVDWIAEDKEGTYEDVEVKEAKRELKKLEDVDLPLLNQNMTKIYILEGESKLHEVRLKTLKLGAKYLEIFGDAGKKPEEAGERIKRHKHVLHYMNMERENAIEVWDILNKILGIRLELPEDDERLRRVLATQIKRLEWQEKDLEDALYELGRMAGVEVEADLPPFIEMSVNLSVENVTLETVIGIICEIHPLDWRFVDGRLFFAHLQSDK